MTIYCDQLLRQNYILWKRVGYSRGKREVAGEYVCTDGAQGTCLKQGLGGWCKLFGIGYMNLMVGVVDILQIIFLEVAIGVLE